MDITFIIELLSIFIVLICSYILVLNPRKKETGNYSKPDWNYFIKKFISYYRISEFKKTLKHDWRNNGKYLESPTTVKNENSFDSLSFYGFNTNGSSLVVRINKRGFKIVEVWLQIRLKNGNIYQLPVHPSTSISSREKNIWSAYGIKFTILEPFKRIRVTFNGLLRNCSSNNQEIIHGKFNFIWTSCAIPTHWPFDHDTSLLSESISLEAWRNGHWLDRITNPLISGYDQYGVLYGEVILGDEKIELNLPSLRSRRKGNNSSELRQHLELMGVCEDGTLFQIGASSCSNLTNFKFGTVRTMNELNYPLNASDISLEFMGPSVESIPRMFVVNFQVNGKKYNNIFYLKTESVTKLYGGNPWNFESNIFPFDCSFTSEFGNGLAIFEYKYKGPCNVPLLVPRNYLTFADIQDNQCESLIVKFDEKLCQAVSIVGGKGASLSLMASIDTFEFAVPDGFCLTKYSLEKHLQISDLPFLVREIEKYTLSQIKELETACKMTEKRITVTPISDSISALVKEHLNELRKKTNELHDQKTCRFAVRSSGLNEDSEESSAAGQNETILGCLTDEDVLNAILKCWASLFAFRSVVYRRQHGQPVNCGMGVVIQVMVPSEISGVMFTCHPTTQNSSQILISASYGLGESVVSALVHPDQFIIEKTWDDDISIQSKQLGDKSTQITMSETSTNTVNVNYKNAEKFCMIDEDALDIAKIGMLLQELFEYYCDVEWAFYKGKIYILQCRAITTINKWTEFELTHEFDVAILTDNELTTFANCIEVCPKPMSTLTISHLPYFVNKNRHFFHGTDELHYYYNSSSPLINQRLCLNVLGTVLSDLEEEIKISNRVTCLAVLGEDIIDEKIHKIAITRNSRNTHKKGIKFTWKILKSIWNNSKSFEFTKKLSENFKLDIEVNNSKDLLNTINNSIHKIGEFSDYHINSSSSSIFYKIFVMSSLLESNSEITPEHLNDFTHILSLENNALSVDIPKNLKKISTLIARSGKSEEFQQLPAKEGLEWLKTNVPEAEKQFQDILKEHGHRGIMEFDMMHDPWILNPLPLVETVQSTANMTMNNQKKIAENIQNVIENLKTPKRRLTKHVLKFLIPRLLSAIRNREFTKSAVVLILHKFRLAYRRLGYLLEKEGKLPSANLIHFLTNYEINELVNENKTELIEKATKRQKLYPQWNKIKFEEYNYGRAKPIPDNMSTIIDNLNTACSLKGTPVYPGLIQNRACVITDISEAHLIKPNDVLITTSTDVGWSPYFPMISGLVTEIGGLISHGAVIAREYGIPCVIGVKGATKSFVTDNQVILDGNKGKITRIITKNE